MNFIENINLTFSALILKKKAEQLVWPPLTGTSAQQLQLRGTSGVLRSSLCGFILIYNGEYSLICARNAPPAVEQIAKVLSGKLQASSSLLLWDRDVFQSQWCLPSLQLSLMGFFYLVKVSGLWLQSPRESVVAAELNRLRSDSFPDWWTPQQWDDIGSFPASRR